MSLQPPDGPEVRVGHADRDRTIEILNQATAEGRLTLPELEARIEAAAAATFESELDALIADLPEGRAKRQRLERMAQLPVASGAWAPPGTLELHAVWSGIVRAGQWRVPEWIIATPQWSAVVLNMLEAIPPPSGLINIELRGQWGTFMVILPPGWGINHDGVTSRSAWTTASFEGPVDPQPGKPQIRLFGSQGDGRLVVRSERWWDNYLHATSKN